MIQLGGRRHQSGSMIGIYAPCTASIHMGRGDAWLDNRSAGDNGAGFENHITRGS